MARRQTLEPHRRRPDAPSRGRRALLVLLSLAAGIAAGLLVAEGAMRLFGIRPERYPQRGYKVLRDGAFVDCASRRGCGISMPSVLSRMGVRTGDLTPGVAFKMIYGSNPRGYFDADMGVEFRINRLGLRGPEIEPVKPAGTYRILGLGDSFTFGEGVRDEHTFLRRIEESLRAAAPPGVRYEVLNAGTPGYNTRDEVLNLEHRWMPLEPDLVLITFYLNDAYSDRAFLNRGQDMGVYLATPDGIARWSRLADYLQHAWRVRQVRREVEAYYRERYFAQADRVLEGPEGERMDWRASRAALERAALLARERGFRLALVVFPEMYRLDGDYPFAAIHRLVMETCASLGIPALDLLDAFRGRRAETLWVHVSDHHPNESAHAIAAEAIEPFLRRVMQGS